MVIPPVVHFRQEFDRRVKGKPRHPARSPPATLDTLPSAPEYYNSVIIVIELSRIVTLYHATVVAHSINHRFANRLSPPCRQPPNHIPVFCRNPNANLHGPPLRLLQRIAAVSIALAVLSLSAANPGQNPVHFIHAYPMYSTSRKKRGRSFPRPIPTRTAPGSPSI